MELALESVLQERSRQLDAWLSGRRNFLFSVVLHLVLLTSFVLIPILTQTAPDPIEFTPITIVPVQALGVQTPVQAAEPARPAPPRPEPEPEPAAPASEPEPEPERQSLPAPDTTPAEPAPAKPAARERPDGESDAGRRQGELGQRQGSPLGSSLGTSAFGAAVGGLDNPDFVYGYYVDQMLAMIGAQWQRPALGAEVEAIVHFRIHTDGHISDLRVLQSSGYNSYDLAGLRAVQLAAPFPRLPQSFRHKSLGVNLILR